MSENESVNKTMMIANIANHYKNGIEMNLTKAKNKASIVSTILFHDQSDPEVVLLANNTNLARYRVTSNRVAYCIGSEVSLFGGVLSPSELEMILNMSNSAFLRESKEDRMLRKEKERKKIEDKFGDMMDEDIMAVFQGGEEALAAIEA